MSLISKIKDSKKEDVDFYDMSKKGFSTINTTVAAQITFPDFASSTIYRPPTVTVGHGEIDLSTSDLSDALWIRELRKRVALNVDKDTYMSLLIDNSLSDTDK